MALSLLLILSIAGCGQTPFTRTILDGFGWPRDSIESLRLLPNLSYLRVTVQGKPSLMVLGYVAQHEFGTLETWYSSSGQVLELLDGKLHSTEGFATNWPRVDRSGFPGKWADALSGDSTTFTRLHDQMPNYRYNIKNLVSLIETPVHRHSNLYGVEPSAFRWLEETAGSLPSARYALALERGTYSVFYGEQCLTPDYCISWQRWPVRLEQGSK